MEERKREREKTGMQSTKEKTKKPRTRRVSKYTLSLFPTHTLSTELKVSSNKKQTDTERCGKTLHNSSPVKKRSSPTRKKEENEGLLARDDRLASSPPRLASPRQHCKVYMYILYTNYM